MLALTIVEVLETTERLTSCEVSMNETLLLEDMTTLVKLQGITSNLAGIRSLVITSSIIANAIDYSQFFDCFTDDWDEEYAFNWKLEKVLYAGRGERLLLATPKENPRKQPLTLIESSSERKKLKSKRVDKPTKTSSSEESSDSDGETINESSKMSSKLKELKGC
ncbi:hypothetical protein LR48_Vigan03g167400 [Vigna angularis]|uniref:Uncharacterized protein n=1 Tax=Phaseolus angularis TaxID=3914 RepID=A0A0L9U6J5_PHAAN|nr:hypothetical protein LR48_Vigan03g167400 [Vigna angularis]